MPPRENVITDKEKYLSVRIPLGNGCLLKGSSLERVISVRTGSSKGNQQGGAQCPQASNSRELQA